MIKKLKKEDGGVVEREEEIGPFITNYYKSLFVSSAGTPKDDILKHVPLSVTPPMNDIHTKLFQGRKWKVLSMQLVI